MDDSGRKYASASRQDGELSPREFAARVGGHKDTVVRWAKAACAGQPSRLSEARIDCFGRYWIPEKELERVQARRDPDANF